MLGSNVSLDTNDILSGTSLIGTKFFQKIIFDMLFDFIQQVENLRSKINQMTMEKMSVQEKLHECQEELKRKVRSQICMLSI